jgi:D-tyrosyl-tRNA(Tyr) deacylase
MKLLVQRVSEASVSIDNVVKGAIGKGYMVLIGCRFDDSARDVDYLVQRLSALRIFEDSEGKMNLSIEQVGGSVLLISQFTLYADTKKGNRPSFIMSGDPDKASALYDYFIQQMRERLGNDRVACGEFGAEMKVSLVNDGPVTIELSSDSQQWHGKDSATSKPDEKSIKHGNAKPENGKPETGKQEKIKLEYRQVESQEDMAAAFKLISEIWSVCYRDVISKQQMDYMISYMYSPETIRKETADGRPMFLVKTDENNIGLLSYELDPDPEGVIYLHKIYLLPTLWGRGLGSTILSRAINHAKNAGATAVELNVNKKNTRAIRSYERNGFVTKSEIVKDIGNGFIMDDFLMRKEINNDK